HESVLVVPAQETRIRMIDGFAGQRGQCLPMQAVIRLAIEILIADPATDSNLQIRLDRNQPRIEELVEVRSEEQAVVDVVGALVRVWEDVGRLQRRQRVLPG